MNRKAKLGILILVVLLAVGFAAVATTLLINGTARVGINEADFDVYFSRASTDVGGTAVIDPTTRREITYTTKELKSIGDTATLKYAVMNNSSQYDADVSVTFTATNVVDSKDYTDYYSISRTGFDVGNTTVVQSKKFVNGTIVITLLKPVLEDVEIEFTLTLTVNVTERTETGVYVPQYEILSGDLDTVGSVVKIADEEFYVIGQEDTNHVKLFAKYNLNVGNNIQTGTVGIQNSLATGYVSGGNTVDGYYPGTVTFADHAYWFDEHYDSENTLKPEYGTMTGSSVYVYDHNSNLYQYVENYVDYLNNQGVNVTGRLISLGEIETLGCQSFSCASAPSWLYTTSYWGGSGSINEIVLVVGSGQGYYTMENIHRYNLFGVRPVIILEK